MKFILTFFLVRSLYAFQFWCRWLCSSCFWLKSFHQRHLPFHYLANICYSLWHWYRCQFGRLCAFWIFISGNTKNHSKLKHFPNEEISIRSPSTHNMSPFTKKMFLGFLPKLMMMRRTQYNMPDYDDNAPYHGYCNDMDVRYGYGSSHQRGPVDSVTNYDCCSFSSYRDSVSDFTSDYKLDGQDGNFENIGSNVPHTSGKNTWFDLSRIPFTSCFLFTMKFNVVNWHVHKVLI